MRPGGDAEPALRRRQWSHVGLGCRGGVSRADTRRVVGGTSERRWRLGTRSSAGPLDQGPQTRLNSKRPMHPSSSLLKTVAVCRCQRPDVLTSSGVFPSTPPRRSPPFRVGERASLRGLSQDPRRAGTRHTESEEGCAEHRGAGVRMPVAPHAHTWFETPRSDFSPAKGRRSTPVLLCPCWGSLIQFLQSEPQYLFGKWNCANTTIKELTRQEVARGGGAERTCRHLDRGPPSLEGAPGPLRGFRTTGLWGLEGSSPRPGSEARVHALMSHRYGHQEGDAVRVS